MAELITGRKLHSAPLVGHEQLCCNMKTTWIIAISCTIISKILCHKTDTISFPDGFKFGAATSAYQIEGAWNVSDKGVSIWDYSTHACPSCTGDHTNGDVACDSYNKYKEDVQLLRKIGFNYYRFSISWTRVLPTGLANRVSKDGIRYYKNLIQELLDNGIEPIVTLYHFDHPQLLEEMGGWTNELMVDWFVDYARVIFEELGPSVKIFVTINEPQVLCGINGRPSVTGKSLLDIGMYLCYHNILKAHAKTYHMYDEEFRPSQQGQIGLAHACDGCVPDESGDTTALETKFQFDCGIIAHPIYIGDYPPIVKTRVAMISEMQGYSVSRLPEFSPEWISYIKGTADFFGLNHYTSYICVLDPDELVGKYNSDSGVKLVADSSWATASSFWLKVVPEGFGDTLRKIKEEYDNPPVFVLENGYSDHGELEDRNRISYHHSYLRELIMAVKRDGCRVLRYTVWSLLDNFQFDSGYTQPFGIISVDFNSTNRDRTAKLSAIWWQEVIRTRRLQDCSPWIRL